MTSNIGTWDRTLRIAVGLALLSLVFVGPQTIWGLARPYPPRYRSGPLLPGLSGRRRQYVRPGPVLTRMDQRQ